MPLLSQIYIYPVKSFSGVKLETTTLSNGEGLPGDRRFAITNGISNTMDGAWLTCRSFFINAVNDGLQKFSLELQGDTIRLTSPEGLNLSFQAGDREGLAIANRRLGEFISSLHPDANMPAPQITERTQTKGALSGYWDFTDSGISLMNEASLKAVGEAMGKSLDIRRLRGNLYISDLPAWEEFGLIGKAIRIGANGPELDILRPVKRCPATSVNPQTGDRDVKVPDALMDHFGHVFCGLYAKVTKPGEVHQGDAITIIGDAKTPLIDAANPQDSDYKLWPKMAEVVDIAPLKGEGALITLKSASHWPLPDAIIGQRIRFHISKDLIGIATVTEHRDHTTVVHVEPSQTDDPATAFLLEKVKAVQRLIVSGPFGRGS